MDLEPRPQEQVPALHRVGSVADGMGVNCPACGAPMRLDDSDDHFTCEFCGRLHFPEPDSDGVRVLGAGTDARCPVCAENLVHAAVAGARVLHCTACRGLLVPAEAFLYVVEALSANCARLAAPPRPIAPRELERRLACPHCHQEMDTHPYAGPGNIVIDNCAHCHLNWLDHGELRRVAAAATSDARLSLS